MRLSKAVPTAVARAGPLFSLLSGLFVMLLGTDAAQRPRALAPSHEMERSPYPLQRRGQWFRLHLPDLPVPSLLAWLGSAHVRPSWGSCGWRSGGGRRRTAKDGQGRPGGEQNSLHQSRGKEITQHRNELHLAKEMDWHQHACHWIIGFAASGLLRAIGPRPSTVPFSVLATVPNTDLVDFELT